MFLQVPLSARELAESLIRATRPGLVSPGGSKQSRRYRDRPAASLLSYFVSCQSLGIVFANLLG